MRPILTLLLFCTATQACAQHPNIVLFVTDDQGTDAGCYGNPVIRTPHLDALARDGVVFDRAFCTTSSCSPSRSVILSGLHNHTNGQYGLGHHSQKFSAFSNLVSLPACLRQAGYATAMIGKLHVYPQQAVRFDLRLPATNSRSSVEMAEACRGFIEADREEPFFLYFCTSDPHRGGQYDEEDPTRPNLFGNHTPYPGVEAVEYAAEEVIVPGWLPDTPACRAELAEYYESVSRADQGLGRVVQILKDAGHWDNTVLLYISDHGAPMQGAKTTMYEPGMLSPCVVRDPDAQGRVARSDALVSWVDLTPTVLDYAGALDRSTGRAKPAVVDPLIEPSRRSGGQSMPGLPAGGFHGLSLRPILRGEPAPERDRVFGSHTFHEVTMHYPMRVVREQRWKLIWNLVPDQRFPSAMDLFDSGTWQDALVRGPRFRYGKRTVHEYLHRPEFELFDLKADPLESQNLAGDPAYAVELERLKALLLEFMQETSDPWLTVAERRRVYREYGF